MALNIFEEIDITDGADTQYEGHEKAKNNWSTMDTELHNARGGEANLTARIDALNTRLTALEVTHNFLVTPASAQSNIAAGSDVDVIWGTEIFDIGSNFASNTFTAPVTGYYQFNCSIRCYDIDADATALSFAIVTSNRDYYNYFDPAAQQATDIDNLTFSWSVLANMTAAHTAKVIVNQTGGSGLDIQTGSWFSGFYVA